MSVAASFLDIGDEKEVVDYVREMTPLICLSIIMDNLQAVLSALDENLGVAPTWL